MSEDRDIGETTTLQLIRQCIRSRNLGRLRQAMERPWAMEMIAKAEGAGDEISGEYRIFEMAIKDLEKEERQRAFQWTWDCYHPLMGDLGKAIQNLDRLVNDAPH